MDIVREGKVVWSYSISKDGEFDDCTLRSNGNTLICNWIGSLKQEEWPVVAQAIEVTPDKKVVWALRDWETLGPATSAQLLDLPGVPENGDLQS